MFGRESMEDVVSARATPPDDEIVVNHTPPASTPPALETAGVSAKASTVEEEMEAFFALFQKVESRLHAFVSETDKKRIRKALSPPSSEFSMVGSEQGLVTIGVSIILTALVMYVCKPTPPRTTLRYGYRSSSPASSEKKNDVVSWNIGRLLRPLNRSH